MSRLLFLRGAVVRVSDAPDGTMLFSFRCLRDGALRAEQLKDRLLAEMRRRGAERCEGPVSDRGFAYLDGLDTVHWPVISQELPENGFTVSERYRIYRIPQQSLLRFSGADRKAYERYGVTVSRFYPYRNRADAEKYYAVAKQIAPVDRNSLFRALGAFSRGFSAGACFLAERNGDPCGVLLLSKELQICTARTLAVIPGERKHAVAAALIGAALGVTCRDVYTGSILTGNLRSERLVRNAGGVLVGERRIYSIELNKN